MVNTVELACLLSVQLVECGHTSNVHFLSTWYLVNGSEGSGTIALIDLLTANDP